MGSLNDLTTVKQTLESRLGGIMDCQKNDIV